MRGRILAVLLVAFTSTIGESGPERVFVGARVCARCHHETDRDQFSRWYRSPHASAWTDLALPEAAEIARLSGIDEDPFESPICLGCHATAADTEPWQRDPTFAIEDGVQCELCHGPGSVHVADAIAAGAATAATNGLEWPGPRLCMVCHKPKGSHTSVLDVQPFEIEDAMARIAHPGRGGPSPESVVNEEGAVPPHTVTEAGCTTCHDQPSFGMRVDPRSAIPTAALRQADVASAPLYKTPFNLVVSRDGRRLFAVCEASDSVVVVETATRAMVAEIAVGNLPHGICLSPDGHTAYVSNRGDDTVSIIDLSAMVEMETIAIGDEPHGVVTDVEGRTLYVANAGSSDVSVVDLESRREIKRLSAARGAWGVSLSPDGNQVYVTANLSHFVPFRTPSRSEVTVIDTARQVVDNRVMIPEANLVQGVDVAPGGDFALVTLIRTKNLVPMTRVLQGWVMTNGIGILWRDGRVDQLLLDEPDNSFADPTDVVITTDGRFAFVSGGGVDEVAVVDLDRMQAVLEAADENERREMLPNHFGVTTEFVERRIPVGRNPRGLAVSPDGRTVYVAEALDDAVAVIDVARREKVATIDLGGPEDITQTRKGERIFHSAEVTYGRQFSCHSCHPDGGIDAITYDIEPDGIGVNPVDNRTLRGILDTAPFKWTGKNPTLSRQCGPRLAVFFTRLDPFTPDQVVALESYIRTIPRNPNRYRGVGSELTPAQRRGKSVFERSFTNGGAPIPVEKRCSTCHPAPYFTNREQVFVGVGSELDTHDVFDVPHLNNIYESAPYLHDGRADTLEEIWTRFNPKDEHGVTNDMTKDQLNDLIEYLKTL